MLYDLAASDVITSDKKSMVADSFVLWKITDPLKFIQTLSGSVANAESRINAVVYNSLKTVISSMKQEAVISGRDGELAAAIMENFEQNFDDYGLTVLAIETKRIDLPDENKAAVYERMISERGNIAASYAAEGDAQAKHIRSEADKSVEITVSEAKAQAERIKAEGKRSICAFCLRRMTRRRKRTSTSSCARSIWREARSLVATRRWCSRLIPRLRRFSADSGGRRNDALSAGGTVLARPF